ncbi:MAG: hypothetical protein HY290_29365 [Planctomycetia bacterium]|nr:hypothetical protein [Planctomycetia bacterium]
MLIRIYLILGLVVSVAFSGAAASGWRMFPRAAPGSGAAGAASGRPGGIFIGGGHQTSGSSSSWHGGK